MDQYLIASYPRSGSTWLRFILANLLRDNEEHTFDSVERLIPAIEDYGGMKQAGKKCRFFKTHKLRHGNNVIFLHRHIGDVLISEYWYKKKYDSADNRSLLRFMIETEFGSNWRQHVDHYFPSNLSLSYDHLHRPEIVWDVLSDIEPWNVEQVTSAIEKSNFGKMRKAEEKGFGIYPTGNPDIKFVRECRSGQWRDLPEPIQEEIIDRNYIQLKALDYL